VRKLNDAWAKVTLVAVEGEQPALGQVHSSSIRLMVRNNRQLNAPLKPFFQQPAHQQYGLWACHKCVAQHAVAAVVHCALWKTSCM